ncbi:hypothetical protein PENANT_c013G08704 [Penicillium antarcticum]|uniref:Uncharacterized protein n=1 Tax=Penicillium antarcticum TaxID=416450 RepID=A0A1V6Q536_9EURO|nr:uncharacterized protein N7508_004222 [Penicillium antarcticum]KAJ5308843.1 hypothetical protein N7508_004222 [Penicillium antarcticum]OQD84349.1 hypothetical protein PENANT_c013G08704 [Penicillium antarcticum]
MFKPTEPMLMRLRLTTKQVNGGYYKGNRTGSMGSFDKKGQYRSQVEKHRNYIPAAKLDLPGLPEGASTKEPFLLTPFVTKHMRPTPSNYVQDLERNGKTVTVIRGFEGTDYLNMWADTREAFYLQRFPQKSKKSKKSKKSTEETSDQ